MEDVDYGKTLRLFIMKKNQLKMVKRRGYSIEREQSFFNLSIGDFINSYVPFAKKLNKSVRSVLSQVYENENGEKLYTFFADDDLKHKQMGVDILGEMIQEMDKYKAKNGILITPLPLSSAARKKIEELLTYNIHVFQENEMSYDPTEHYFTPEHRLLSVEEQRDFLTRNKISIDKLPIILTTDMISRYYGFKPGQVIEIKRINLYDTIVQESLSYRVVK